MSVCNRETGDGVSVGTHNLSCEEGGAGPCTLPQSHRQPRVVSGRDYLCYLTMIGFLYNVQNLAGLLSYRALTILGRYLLYKS